MISCKKCSAQFQISEQENTLREKISPVIGEKKFSLPAPTLCPDCRQQKRLTYRNERFLYRRRCDATAKEIISIYNPNAKLKVYAQGEWWGDGWDGLTFGRDFDFSRPFFDQFFDLYRQVPKLALNNFHSENSEYCHITLYCKDCYLLFASNTNENIQYGYWIYKSKDMMDCVYTYESELCYGLVDCNKGYRAYFSQDCDNIRDSYFCYDCRDVEECIGCVGLRRKKYHIFNVEYSKEEYEKKKEELKLNSHKGLALVREKFEQLKLQTPRRFNVSENSQTSSGDYLSNSDNCAHCFDSLGGKDSIYVYSGALGYYDCLDSCYVVNSSYCYGTLSSFKSPFSILSSFSVESSNIIYSDACYNSNDLFGCAGLRKKGYCILNKQYTKEEYEALVPKIIEHMKTTGEWGEFFPEKESPFDYNESVAQQYYPLAESEAIAKGFGWKPDTEKVDLQPDGMSVFSAVQIPDSIGMINEEIMKAVLLCEVTGKPYKVIPQELAFYMKNDLPLPKRCPEQRHQDRMALRNSRKLYDRSCMCADSAHKNHQGQCAVKFQTPYAPTREEKVFCEECYNETIY